MHQHNTCEYHSKFDEHMKYCRKCDVFYCEKCGAEWKKVNKSSVIYRSPYLDMTYTTCTIDCCHSEEKGDD